MPRCPFRGRIAILRYRPAAAGRHCRGIGPSLGDLRREISAILRAQIGHDFAGHMTKTFLRRVQRRMQILQIDAVALDFEHVQTFALALHDLATDAIKHGALAQPEVRLAIGWTVETSPVGGRRLVLDWIEGGVAMPAEPERRGFGRDPIEKAPSYSLRARTRFVLVADGVRCRYEP